MSGLAEHVADYLGLRRSLGYKLERAGLLLAQFVEHCEEKHLDTVTVEAALSWATSPAGGSAWWWSQRLSVVRCFAVYLHTVDPAAEIPPKDLLPARPPRATPYIYTDGEVSALIAAAAGLRHPLRTATYQTFIGLLAVTGMRVGEAIRLNTTDVDLCGGVITIRHTKFDKSRQNHLHPTSTAALTAYLAQRDRHLAQAVSPALFVSPGGTRLLACNVETTFRILVTRAGLKPRSAACRPRMHDLRHTFAATSLLDGYVTGGEVGAVLPVISTWMGHVNPTATYWYLSAVPELLGLAAQRLDVHRGGSR
jgi:integrase